MTFAPNPPGRPALSPVFRTGAFWIAMVALAVVLWSMNRGSNQTPGSPAMPYSDFMAQVDRNNVKSARLVESPSTADVRGELREPTQTFAVTVPKEIIPDLSERLRRQGVSLEVEEAKRTTWATPLIKLAPFLVILAIWIFRMKAMQARRSSPPPQSQSPAQPTGISNRPLG